MLPATPPSRNRFQGFTLIELLVAVGIIGVLTALVVPAVGRSLENAAMTKDMNSLKQIGQGIAAFAADNDGRIPHRSIPVAGTKTSETGSDRESFMESVDRSLVQIPGFSSNGIYNWTLRPIWFSKDFAQMPPGQTFNPKTQWYWGTAWGMNVYLWENSSPLNGANAFNGYINRAPDRSKLVIVGEKNRNGGHFFDPRTPPVFEKNVETQYRVSRNGKAYYLFGDFHIELIEGDQSVATNPTFKTYNPSNRLYYAW